MCISKPPHNLHWELVRPSTQAVLEEAPAILDEPDHGRALRVDDTGLIVVIAGVAPMLWLTAVWLTVVLDQNSACSHLLSTLKSSDRFLINVYL